MELVFEIGCEELPASFLEPTLQQIRKGFLTALTEARIAVDPDDLQTFGTPRRLTLLVRKIAERQDDLEEERTGPPAHVAFKDGEPTGAAKGFARAQGVDVTELYTVETSRGEVLAAKVFEQGLPTREILPGILTRLIKGLNFAKSMRWGAHKATFGRPVRWILAVLDGQVVPLEFAGVQSGNRTRGHRFAAPQEFEVKDINSYREGLEKAFVVLDPEERRRQIRDFLGEHAQAAGGRVVEDPELIEEVANLIEKPHALTLEIDEKYLELPREVLISSMRSHQRYFAIEETDGTALKPACVVIYNTPVRDPALVAKGNLKVLRARLDDAQFFWEKDLETGLEDNIDRLSDVIWIGPLGSMQERSKRIATLAKHIAEAIGLGSEEAEFAARAGLLSKTDLVSNMVDEFPDLQGLIGGEYAAHAGEPKAVALAIREQYLPKSADDALPSTGISAAVALAEKLDAIVGCFGVGMIPTSTADPYGLRRAALGILKVLHDRGLTISPKTLIELAIDAYPQDPSPFKNEKEELTDLVLSFLTTRLHYLLVDIAPTDVVKAVLATGVDEIPSVYGRVEALKSLRDLPDFEPLALGFKRIDNILRKQAEDQDLASLRVDPERFVEAAENELFAAFQTAQKEVEEAMAERAWRRACDALIALKAPVDNFFDSVMVMVDDEGLKENRIALLATLEELFLKVADISEIQT